MAQTPLISIVMPVKNGEPYLKETLDSILAQTYRHWECIIVNDHSIDNTTSVLSQYSQSDNRVQWLDNNGNGIIDALRLAYRQASGTYITRMDADDIMPSNKLTKLLDPLLCNPIAVSTGYVKYFSDQTINDGYERYQNWLNTLCDNKSHYQEIYKECVIPSPCWMMHRNTFDEIGGFESDNYPEDYDLVFRMYKHGIPVVAVKEVLHHWRDHPTRASRNDDNYKDNRFLDLKLKYFLQLECKIPRSINLIGAGKKGKIIAQHLKSKNVSICWHTNNPNKIGHNIYGLVLKDLKHLSKTKSQVTVIAVSNPLEQLEIRKILSACAIQQYFFFT